jgi:hypothetical protein
LVRLRAEPKPAHRRRWNGRTPRSHSEGGAVKAEATVIAAYLALAIAVIGVVAAG